MIIFWMRANRILCITPSLTSWFIAFEKTLFLAQYKDVWNSWLQWWLLWECLLITLMNPGLFVLLSWDSGNYPPSETGDNDQRQWHETSRDTAHHDPGHCHCHLHLLTLIHQDTGTCLNIVKHWIVGKCSHYQCLLWLVAFALYLDELKRWVGVPTKNFSLN